MNTEKLPVITVCDDEPDQAKEWLSELENLDGVKGVFEVRRLEKTSFQQAIAALELRRTSLRKDRELPPGDKANPFDESEVLIVDFDLFDFETDNQRLTGRDVAYLARCYSACGFIVGVNLDKVMNPFDLSLQDHPESFVDLALGGSQIADPSLWSAGDHLDGRFRPWSWPLIPERAAVLRSKASELELRMDDSLSDVLELPEATLQNLTRVRSSALEIPDDPHESLNVPVSRWLTEATMGIDQKDFLADNRAQSRVLAARLLKWFEVVVLPGQDLLVDAPHLIERRPGLLAGSSSDAALWTNVCRFDLDASELPINHDLLDRFQWKSDWTSRPVWLWSELSVDPQIADARKAPRPEPRTVFAEDVSGFVPRDSATSFEARVDSPFRARWVAQPLSQDPVQYIPSSLLATG